MFEVFEDYLRGYGIVAVEELELIRSVSVCKSLTKKDYLLQEGNSCRHTTFVCKGCLRSYRIRKDGAEDILDFAIERCWINDHVAFHNGEPASLGIDALEDSEVIQWSAQSLNMLQAAIPAFHVFYRRHLEQMLHQTQRRIISMLGNTAQDKYEDFKITYPELYHRVPLHMIASYLGISRETLSRARNNCYNSPRFQHRHITRERHFGKVV